MNVEIMGMPNAPVLISITGSVTAYVDGKDATSAIVLDQCGCGRVAVTLGDPGICKLLITSPLAWNILRIETEVRP